MNNTNITLENLHSHLINEMERNLSTLAARWRSHQETSEATEIIRQYQAILRCMVELGYQDSLDVDAELPDEYLPKEYLAAHTHLNLK